MAEKEKKKRRLPVIQNEERLYFVLQIIFSVLQVLLCYTVALERNLSQGGIIIFALVGIALLMLAGKGWQRKGARVLGRVLIVGLLSLFMVVVLLDVFTTRVTDNLGIQYVSRSFSSYADQLLADTAKFIQPLLLLFFPTLAIAARRVGEKFDIVLLRVHSWLLVCAAAATLTLALEKGDITALDFSAGFLGLSAPTLLVIYLICTLASVFAVFMLYPYGLKKFRKNKTE